MDDIKDTQKTNTLSVILDAQTRTNPFGMNRAAERAYRRAERICAAVYLLSAHISEEESIRSELRSESGGLLSDVLSLRDDMRSAQSQHVLALQLRIRHMISLVRILGVAGFISESNAGTMIEALDELGHFATTSQRSSLSESISITREDLMDISTAPVRQETQRAIKDNRTNQSDTNAVKDSSNMSNRAVSLKKTVGSRVHNILEVLRTGGELGIRDIAANLPEYSEKMIQRELLGMVAGGQVHKAGLKRWSRYSVAQ